MTMKIEDVITIIHAEQASGRRNPPRYSVAETNAIRKILRDEIANETDIGEIARLAQILDIGEVK